MRRKVTSFALEIHVHAVTCPGVWLCPDGDVSVQLKLFDEFAETRRIEPVFPILYHEKFTFQKLFPDIYFLTELQEALDQETLVIDLVQWPMSSSEILLATFESTLLDLLYPSACRKTTEVDLLMDPTDAFPGILAPKIESSTKTTVEEIPLTENELLDVSTSFMNTSKGLEKCVVASIRDPIKRQRKVCHSRGRHDCTLNMSKDEKSGRNLDTSMNTSMKSRRNFDTSMNTSMKSRRNFDTSMNTSRRTRRNSPFAIRTLDTTTDAYENFLNATRKSERKRDYSNSTQLGYWTSVSGGSSFDETPIKHTATFHKSRKNKKGGAGSPSRPVTSSTVWNSTINDQKKSPKIAIDPRRSVNDPEPHNTDSCLMCSTYNSFFEGLDSSGIDKRDT